MLGLTNKKKKAIVVCNCACAVLLLMTVILQFSPFWPCADCKVCENGMASLADYVWFPEKHKPVSKALTEVFKEHYGDNYVSPSGKAFKYRPDFVIVAPAVVFLSGVAGMILCIWSRKKSIIAAIPLINGFSGVYGFTTNPGLQSGDNWIGHLVVAVLVSVAALTCLIIGFVGFVQNRTHRKR